VLVALYTGPVGLLIYWISCREPAPGTHEQFVAPLWKQTVGSTIHCLAGDATGIIAAAIVTSFFRLPMGLDIWVEYLAGFLSGLLVFQALFMKGMLGVSYLQAVKQSFLPEWLSMNAVMADMIPTMVLLMTHDMGAMEPDTPLFWGVMFLATIVWAIVAYLVNYWLVKNKHKHGMDTERALGKSGAPTEETPGSALSASPPLAMAGMSHGLAAEPSPIPAQDTMSGMSMAGMEHAGMDHQAMSKKAAPAAGGAMAGMDMSHGPNSGARKAAVTVLTLLLLAAGYYVANRYGDLSMRPGAPMAPMPGMNMANGQM